MTDAERRAAENRMILDRMQGAPAIGPGHPDYDPFSRFDPRSGSAQAHQDNDNPRPGECSVEFDFGEFQEK